MASSVHGIHRATADADFAVGLQSQLRPKRSPIGNYRHCSQLLGSRRKSITETIKISLLLIPAETVLGGFVEGSRFPKLCFRRGNESSVHSRKPLRRSEKTPTASRAVSLPASKASIRRSDSTAQAASREAASGEARESQSTSISFALSSAGKLRSSARIVATLITLKYPGQIELSRCGAIVSIGPPHPDPAPGAPDYGRPYAHVDSRCADIAWSMIKSCHIPPALVQGPGARGTESSAVQAIRAMVRRYCRSRHEAGSSQGFAFIPSAWASLR